MNFLIDNILSRRSVRAYQERSVSKEDIQTILTAATWAPSGNNLQPWKFAVIVDDKKLIKQISELTIYSNWVKTAPCLIAVFLDSKVNSGSAIPNNHMKHVQAIGASIQNMLLAASSIGLGTCWIGEILKNEDALKNILKLSSDLELMAVISVGYSIKKNIPSKRNDLTESIISWR